MSTEPPIPHELRDQVPPIGQAAILAAFGSLEARIAALEARIAQDSSNSSRPPSSDPPRTKRRPVPASRKRRGGQPCHARRTRHLVPAERLSGSVECKPSACQACGLHLDGADPEPARHQVPEVPEVRPDVVEYRPRRLDCPGCGATARGTLLRGVPRGSFGPRLRATIALLGDAHRLRKRRVVVLLEDLLGLRISSGMICKAERTCAEALATPVEAACEMACGTIMLSSGLTRRIDDIADAA